jgi:sec-independent protein translocase protein TatA
MNFGNIGFMELMVILVIVLVLFGAKRVPEIGASIGKGIREFKKNINDADREIREPIREAARDATREPTRSTERLSAGEPDFSRSQEEEAVRPEPKRLI